MRENIIIIICAIFIVLIVAFMTIIPEYYTPHYNIQVKIINDSTVVINGIETIKNKSKIIRTDTCTKHDAYIYVLKLENELALKQLTN